MSRMENTGLENVFASLWLHSGRDRDYWERKPLDYVLWHYKQVKDANEKRD